MCRHKNTHINVAWTWASSQSTQVTNHYVFSISVSTWYLSTPAFDSPTANWPLKLLCLGLSSRSGLTLSRENSSCQSPFTHWSPIVENERFISLLSEDTCCTCAKHKNTQRTNRTNPKRIHTSTNSQKDTKKRNKFMLCCNIYTLSLFETVHSDITLNNVNEMSFYEQKFLNWVLTKATTTS